MSDVWNTNPPCPVCAVPRRPEDTRCRRCGQPFAEASGPAASPSLSRAPTAATLVLRQVSPPSTNGHTWQVSGAPAEVGRDRGTIMLRDKSVSRQHARITPDSGGGFVLQDLNSTNGTRVNNQPLVAPSPIRDGDQVAFGDVVLVAEIRRPAAAAVGPFEPPVGITLVYGQAPIVGRAAVASQASIDPTIHEAPVAPVVHRHPVSLPPEQPATPPGLGFGREVLELAQAAEAIAARLRALEAAWRTTQAGGGS